ncbi:hypothetical protein [Hanstruepera flava]|uniref:hypothetical protein n=1 Tax=Hanstruepera flava TaxID=2930218 RepID=UPI002028CC41|nr:hypothetical protein [Hanstruepera flava]
MRRLLGLIVMMSVLLCCCAPKKKELVLLGTVHQSVENFTPDSLYNILVKIKPDLILFEVDSSLFTDTFEFNKTWDSNENIATVKYMDTFDVAVRPYEFTGRNAYRIKIGSRPTDGKATQLLDSLYKNNQLDAADADTYERFLKINDSLNAFAYQGARAFNSMETDKIAEARQDYQYKALLNIMGQYPVFSETYFVKQDGDSISYFEGYKRASEFWDLRNQTMANNILHFIRESDYRKIVVLNGYFHRYYLNTLIRPKQDELNFIVKEFYDY